MTALFMCHILYKKMRAANRLPSTNTKTKLDLTKAIKTFTSPD